MNLLFYEERDISLSTVSLFQCLEVSWIMMRQPSLVAMKQHFWEKKNNSGKQRIYLLMLPGPSSSLQESGQELEAEITEKCLLANLLSGWSLYHTQQSFLQRPGFLPRNGAGYSERVSLTSIIKNNSYRHGHRTILPG